MMKGAITKTLLFLATATLLAVSLVSVSYAEQEMVIFSTDPHVKSQENLEQLSEGVRAILAMYSLQSGGECYTHDESGLVCSLTRSLGLGAQCSEQHLKLVHSWFRGGFPAMSIYQKSTIEREAKSGELKSICYLTPDTATVQSFWRSIRIRIQNNFVFVDAIREWTFSSADGPYYRAKYQTKYQINSNFIAVISHKEIPLKQIN